MGAIFKNETQLYKGFRLVARLLLEPDKIKFRHSFVSAQVFGLPSSTGPLGFPNKVCDTGTFSMFSTVTDFLCQNPQIETTSFSELVTEHLMKLEKEIDGYFPSLGKDEAAYFRNPFNSNAQTLKAGTGMQEELIELQHDGFARDVYSEKNLGDFWFVQVIQKDCGTCHSSIIVVSINMVV